jgi:hypothetical protein
MRARLDTFFTKIGNVEVDRSLPLSVYLDRN